MKILIFINNLIFFRPVSFQANITHCSWILQLSSKIYLLLSKPPSFVFVLYCLNYKEPFLEIKEINKANLISGCHISSYKCLQGGEGGGQLPGWKVLSGMKFKRTD